MTARFLFLLTEGFDETVIDSQVVDTVAALRREGLPFDVLALCDGRNWMERGGYYRQRARGITARTGARVALRPVVRKTDPVGLLAALPQIALELGPRGLSRALVHCRGDWAARFAAHLAGTFPGVRFVYDCRGDAEAEYERQAEAAGEPAEPVLRKIRAARTLAVSRAALVLCVSTPLRDLLVERYGLDPARARVVPGTADEEVFHPDPAAREEARSELGFGDRYVIVYPGRFGRWHYERETLGVVAALLADDPRAYFLVLTPDVDAARTLAGAMLPPGRFEIRSVEHSDVPRHLRAADLGILLRAPDPINVAACPTKFGEFALTGLPTLISAGIGDCSGFVAANHAGAVLEEADPRLAVEAVRALRREPADALRARIGAAALERFAKRRHARELARLYRDVVSDKRSA